MSISRYLFSLPASAAKILTSLIRWRTTAKPVSAWSLLAAAVGTCCLPCVPWSPRVGIFTILGRWGGLRGVCGPPTKLGGSIWENARPGSRKFFWSIWMAIMSQRKRWKSSSWTTWVHTWASGSWSRPGRTTCASSSSLQTQHILLNQWTWLFLLL